jgi:hypothetical protein
MAHKDIRDKFESLRVAITTAAEIDPPPTPYSLPLILATIDILELFVIDVHEIASNTDAIWRNLPES